jgi:lipid-binding SYLF domain-containing protein
MAVKKLILMGLATSFLWGCATGNTPDAKMKNAREETASALEKIYEDHPGAKAVINANKAHVICTGSDSYLFAASTGGGVCTLHEGGRTQYYRFASVGVGAGIGFKQVAFVYVFLNNDALVNFKESGWDGGARAEASAEHDGEGGNASTNQSADVQGVKIYQANLWGAAAQATVQGYKFWKTDFTEDVVQNRE